MQKVLKQAKVHQGLVPELLSSCRCPQHISICPLGGLKGLEWIFSWGDLLMNRLTDWGIWQSLYVRVDLRDSLTLDLEEGGWGTSFLLASKHSWGNYFRKRKRTIQHENLDKLWALKTYPHYIVESSGIQNGSWEVQSVESLPQSAVSMALNVKQRHRSYCCHAEVVLWNNPPGLYWTSLMPILGNLGIDISCTMSPQEPPRRLWCVRQLL